MPALCQLADPTHYRVSDWNIAADPRDWGYWLDLFASFPDRIEPWLRQDGLGGPDFENRWSSFRAAYAEGLTPIRAQAEAGEHMMTIDLCRYRQTMLHRYGWPDPYVGVKARENDLAARMYPRVVERIDATPERQRWDLLLRGLYAGNMFDLGSPKTIEMYGRGEIDFFAIFERIPPRPWFIDDADTLLTRLQSSRYGQAIIFVDNAGTDIVLGVIPAAREIARAGTRVVLAANSQAALNDITITELAPLLERLAADDPVLADLTAAGRLAAVASGGDTPLIDLGEISPECNAEAARSDLVVLHGMGRAVESNWHERFRCDVWRVALLKDESVVRWQGARLFDAVCRFDAKDGMPYVG